VSALRVAHGAALVAALASTSACSQPRIGCRAGRGPSYEGGGFSATYRLVSASAPACAGLHGDVLGLETFSPANGDEPDRGRETLSIEVTRLARLADVAAAAGPGFADATHPIASLGDFASVEPDDAGLCTVSALTAAEQDLAAVPPARDDATGTTQPGQPATHLRYSWHTVKILVNATVPGTAMTAVLDYADVAAGCTGSYDVAGVWPAVSNYTFDLGNCMALREAPDGSFVPIVDDRGDTLADPKLCRPEAHPDESTTFGKVKGAGYELGSGIDPSFSVACENLGPTAKPGDALWQCVLASLPAALR
jgi:hypothetical protein